MRFQVLKLFRFKMQLLFLFAVTGCTNYFNLSPETPFAGHADESILVLGAPSGCRVHIYQGEVIGDKWKMDRLGLEVSVVSKDDYIVVKCKPRHSGENFVLAGIVPYGLGSGLYEAFRGTPVFELEPGKVIYIGTIVFGEETVEKHGWYASFMFSFGIENNYIDAKKYIDQNYPYLEGRLEKGYVTFMESKK